MYMIRHQIIYRHPLLSYLKAGYLLHVMMSIELFILWLVFINLSPSLENTTFITIFSKIIILAYFGSLPVFSQLDARSRYQNYKHIKDQLYSHGFDLRILKPVLKSRCQRDAAQTAAEELGYGDLCRNYFKSSGYCWYHLIPDFVFQKPQFLLSKYFWRTTFFTPTYTPKIDYRNLKVGHPQDQFQKALNEAGQ